MFKVYMHRTYPPLVPRPWGKSEQYLTLLGEYLLYSVYAVYSIYIYSYVSRLSCCSQLPGGNFVFSTILYTLYYMYTCTVQDIHKDVTMTMTMQQSDKASVTRRTKRRCGGLKDVWYSLRRCGGLQDVW